MLYENYTLVHCFPLVEQDDFRERDNALNANRKFPLTTVVAAITYFSMGSSLGWAPIAVEWHRSNPRSNPRVRGNYREIFYVRFVD